MAFTSLSLPIAPNYSGDNYDFWATKMQLFLEASDLWDLVDKGFKTPIANEQLTEEQQKISKENFSKDAKARSILQSAVSDKFFPYIMNATTAKQAWTILKQENLDKNKKWMDSMRAMQSHSGEKPNISGMSIVPPKLRKENENSYEPKFISIGPRFRGTRWDLLQMEKTKWECVSSLLDRAEGNAESKLADCGELILGLEKEVRASYVDLTQMKWRDMANIMLYDACFVLELLNRGLTGMFVESSLSLEECKKVLSDLLVLDNQIPFFILRKLYCQLFDKTDAPIETLALNLFGYKVIPDRILLSDETKNASNFIELVHSYISVDLKDGQESNHLILEIREDIKPVQLHRCATMLLAAGVKINLRDPEVVILQGGFDFRIRFNSSSGTLDIPALYIIETTEARWQNLIAWEHHKMEANGTSKTFICKCTSAALFFNALICCESDVQLLKDRGIIVDKSYKSNKDLVPFFRSIIRGINQDKFDPRYNIFSFDVLNKYHRSPINYGTIIPLRFWHYLTGSPREVLRDLQYAVSLLTILTLLQTIYAVLSYHQSKK